MRKGVPLIVALPNLACPPIRKGCEAFASAEARKANSEEKGSGGGWGKTRRG
jgi:hypothetical protein